MTNKKQLEHVASNFLDTTNTNLTSWIKGIRDGTKGNLLTLYILSLVTGTHCCIHLKQRKCWTMLKEKPITHAELMQRCNIHLTYMGQNNYIQLTLHTTTVQYKFFGIDDPVELTKSETVASRNLTKEELLTLDMLMGDTPKPPLEPVNSGTSDTQSTNVLLVTAEIHAPYDYSPQRKHVTDGKTSQSSNTKIECTKKVDAKLKLSLQYKKENANKTNDDICGNSGKVLINKSSPQNEERQKKLNMENDHNIEDNNPVHTNLEIEKSNKSNEEDMDSDSTILYDIPETGFGNKRDSIETNNSSEPTLILESKTSIAKHAAAKTQKITKKSGRHLTVKTSRTNKDEKQKVRKLKKQKIKTTTTTKKARTSNMKDLTTRTLPKFTYSSYKLSRSKKRKYSFHCPITGCKRSFMSVKSWNLHHLNRHRDIKYQCSTCLKWIKTPSRFNEHKYSHKEARYKCGRCSKTFYFESGLKLHKNLHKRYRTYKCFAKNCNKLYKWPQDLLRHVKSHLDQNLRCEVCDYSTYEKRLLIQHKVMHQDIKNYKCRKNCTKTFKHAMQWYRHEKNCK